MCLGWIGDGLNNLLNAVARLLSPQLEDSAALYTGSLVILMMREFPAQLSGIIQPLIAALVARLATASMPMLITSLLLVFARLALMGVPQFVTLLAGGTVDVKGEQQNSLEFVIRTWTQWQSDVQGSYQIKVTCSAIAELLLSGDSRILPIPVRGKIITPDDGKIRTRSRAKKAPEQYTTVTAASKFFTCLIDTFSEEYEAHNSNHTLLDEYEDEDDDDDVRGLIFVYECREA